MLSLALSVGAIITVCIGDENDLRVPTSDQSCLFFSRLWRGQLWTEGLGESLLGHAQAYEGKVSTTHQERKSSP